MTVLEQMKEFIASDLSDADLRDAYLSVGVKKNTHALMYSRSDKQQQVLYTCLELPVILVNFTMRRQGICREFLKQVHEINPYQATYIDNVHSAILDAALPRWGYTFDGRDSFFKLTVK